MATTQDDTDDYRARHSDDTARDDQVTEDLTDDPADELGITRGELRDGLNKLDGHDPDIALADQDEGADDMREEIEGADQGDSDD